MESTSRRKLRQSEPVENARPALPYVQIPIALLCLPTGERAAAIEVWCTLYHYLRMGSKSERITDEQLGEAPWMIERSAEHGRKGLEILERLGLISRQAKGSSRRVAIACKLRGVATPNPVHGYAKPTVKAGLTVADTPAAGRAWEAWQLVRGN